MEAADFGGWATKADLKCADGLTIMQDAFKHQTVSTEVSKVPLVWAHKHDDPELVLGHAILEQRNGSTYAHGFFNSQPKAQASKIMLEHGDLDSLSIWANALVKKGSQVFHGMIREVSLVLAGANPGAKIDFINLSHGVWDDDEADEAYITMGLPLELSHSGAVAVDGAVVEHGENTRSAQDVLDSMDEDQKKLFYFSVQTALDAKHSADGEDEADTSTTDDTITHQEGTEDMTTSSTRSIFEGGDAGPSDDVLKHDSLGLSHSAWVNGSGAPKPAIKGELFHDLLVDAEGAGASFRAMARRHAKGMEEISHGITNMEILFPEAKLIDNDPQWLKRRTEWVSEWLNGITKRGFSRIKTLYADITEEDARAKGHIKGEFKKEEFFKFAKRVTTATMVYKKQKLDREDVLEITDFDIVVLMKGEMRLMLDEELARAMLIGDGRASNDEDKIKDPGGDVAEGAGIRSIYNDHELYAVKAQVNLKDANSKPGEITDEVIKVMGEYKGSGSPTFWSTRPRVTSMLLERDNDGRRLYRNRAELAEELGVSRIVDVEVMETIPTLVGIVVNPRDYVLGANRGGEVTLFDDFDIDFNQNKWLIETFCSGALNVLKSAIVISERASGSDVLVAPAAPAFNKATGALTITNQTGVVYKHGATVINAAGSPYTVPAGQTWVVDATPASGYYFETSEDDSFTFKADPA